MTYNLRDGQDVQKLDLNAMAEIDTQLNCGIFGIAFYNADDFSSALDSSIFSSKQDSNAEFAVDYNENEETVGVYPISYTIYLIEYPGRNTEVWNAFIVEIIDPCDTNNNSKPVWCPVDFVDPKIETVITPPWMENLTDQTIQFGGSDLVYAFGDPINVYEESMVVSVEGGFADIFIQFD